MASAIGSFPAKTFRPLDSYPVLAQMWWCTTFGPCVFCESEEGYTTPNGFLARASTFLPRTPGRGQQLERPC